MAKARGSSKQKPMDWKKLRAIFVTAGSFAALGVAGYGILSAMHSPLFIIRVVEIADQPENSPVDPQTITTLAAIPVGRVNLFDLRLQEVESRILTHPWVREVQIQKRFPQTVSITPVYRDPRALIQGDDGELAYVDKDGKVFGRVSLAQEWDLPILTGLQRASQERIAQALEVIDYWNRSQLDAESQISSITYDPERGFRALVTYTMLPKRKYRTMVDLGHEIDGGLDAQLGRLRNVFKYLADNSIAVRQIWADAGKKIVVKIARGS